MTKKPISPRRAPDDTKTMSPKKTSAAFSGRIRLKSKGKKDKPTR